MTKKRLAAIAGVALIAVFMFALTAAGGSSNDDAAEATPEPIAVEFETDRAVFPDTVRLRIAVIRDGEREVIRVRNPDRTVTAEITLQPGAQFPWHSHRGPVLVNVVSGELTYVDADDCAGTVYRAGTAFFDLGHGHVHSAFNSADGVTELHATFFKAPAQGPLLIPAPVGCP